MGDGFRRRPQDAGQRWRNAVDFLRRWLPTEAIIVYREMIQEDPTGWFRHPHFAGGVIVEHALRGNGINERALGVEDLDAVWPALLREAVEPGAAGGRATA